VIAEICALIAVADEMSPTDKVSLATAFAGALGPPVPNRGGGKWR
jgi:hypothetical protein